MKALYCSWSLKCLSLPSFSVCVCVCTQVHLLNMHCPGKRLMSGCLLNGSPPYFLSQGLLLNLELPIFTKLADEQGPMSVSVPITGLAANRLFFKWVLMAQAQIFVAT